MKRKYLWQTALLTLLLGGVGGWAYHTFGQAHYFGGYPFIPVFFFVCGVFIIQMVDSCRRLMPGRMLQILMLSRCLRMFLSIVAMLVYCVAVRESAKAFLLAFIIHYLVFLIYDTWFYFMLEVKEKQKKEQE